MRLRFDFVDAHGRPAPMTFDRPIRTIEAWTVADVRPAMAEAGREAAAGRYVAGLVTYEAAAAFDAALTTKPPGDLPLVWFGVFDGSSDARTLRDRARADTRSAPTCSRDVETWSPDVTREEYDAAVARVREAIAAGDSYQANYTFRLRSHLDVPSLFARYQRLVAEQRPPYAAWLDLGRWQVLSLSPELFFRTDAGVITTKPMKGTAPRGLFEEDDARQAEALQQSAKNRAENVMIVDLARNDVGRVAGIGTVHATSLFEIERYPAVFQMTSTVTGRLRADATMTDIFASLFPAGSITGAPKTSSMRLIAEIERAPRGVYCGAVGIMAPGGDAVFNVAIRTAVVNTATGAAEYGVGGGITWDSTPGDEHAEALSKASFLRVQPSFDLLETMRLEDGTFIRLDRHLRRLDASARYFDFAFDTQRVSAALDAHAREHASGLRRARLLLSRNGAALVESTPFASAYDAPMAVALACSPVSSRDRFLFHKTTHRVVYDGHRRAHPGAFDVLLWNERGELTEFTIGNLVVEIDGTRWTPPRTCGLLAGIFREMLLESREIHERALTRADLGSATRIWLINSLREWVEVDVI